MDKENVKFDEVLAGIKERLGKQAVPFCLPLGKKEDFDGFADIVELKARIYDGKTCKDAEIYEDKMDRINELRTDLIETVAGSDEELLEKYFNGEELTMEEIKTGLHKAVKSGEAVPVVVGSAIKDIGTKTLLHMLKEYFPSVSEYESTTGTHPESGDEETRSFSDDEPFSAYVFKSTIDPFVGTINMMQVKSGTLEKDQEIYVSTTEETAKVNQLFYLRGKEQLTAKTVHAGDICAVAKMSGIETGSTLSDKKQPIVYPKATTPKPTMYVAIHPKNKADEDKLSTALAKLHIEDPTFEIRRNKETAQQLIGGQGMIHLGYIIDKMKNMFKVELETQDQEIVYRETIKKTAEGEGRYIKQSGGSGYYGVVEIRFEPNDEEDYVFEEEVFGGAVPKNYFPAVDKGLQEAMEHGVLAGFPVINVKAVLFDGKYHPVDSNEMAFKLAASMAFKDACTKAKPTILEPIYTVEIKVKDEYMGDVLGDINKRRGRVLGMDPSDDGYQKIIAEVPEAEITKYTIDLKAMTQGSGTFTREFARYQEVPGNLVDKIIEEQKEKDE
jgi:elongation factor G